MSAKAPDAETGIEQNGFEVVRSENGFSDVTNAYVIADEGVVGLEVWIPDEDVCADFETVLTGGAVDEGQEGSR